MIRVTIEREGTLSDGHSQWLNDDERRMLCRADVFSQRVTEEELVQLLEGFADEASLSDVIRLAVTPLDHVRWTYTLTIMRGWRDKDPKVQTRTFLNSPSPPQTPPTRPRGRRGQHRKM